MTTINVADPKGREVEGRYVVSEGTIYVLTGAGQGEWKCAEVDGASVAWLAKTLLLELHGAPRATWPAGWQPQ